METIANVREVRTLRTSSGKTRYVLTDDGGREYTTFRPAIAERARTFEGRRARITYHEERRGEYLNVYLDDVAAAEEEDDGGEAHADPVETVAWKTAIDAAPWLVGEDGPRGPTPPDELFERLKPFKELVSEDIREGEPEHHESEQTGGGRR